MLLVNVIRDLLKGPTQSQNLQLPTDNAIYKVLNVGGGSKLISIPAHYQNWSHVLLDIDPDSEADIILDARKLTTLSKEVFDAVYCSHNLEHYYKHDAAKVLTGFLHVLKPQGFAEIHVPDMKRLMDHFSSSGMDIDDVLYQAASGPISLHDVIYGYGKEIEGSGVDFFAHKSGFTKTSLMKMLTHAGFAHVWVTESPEIYSIGAIAFKSEPTPAQLSSLGLAAG